METIAANLASQETLADQPQDIPKGKKQPSPIATTSAKPPFQIKSASPISPRPHSAVFGHRHRYSNSHHSIQSAASSTDFGPDVDGVPLSPLSERDISMVERRSMIMREMVETEDRYVTDLCFLRNYRDPLIALVGTANEIIPKKTINDIFLHYDSILAVNQELRSQLQSRLKIWDGLDQVGDIFLSLVTITLTIESIS